MPLRRRGMQDALEEVRRRAERHAARHGLRLQSDRAQLDYILHGLARNLLQYGRPYCPCREVTGDPDTDRRNICPCRTHREEIEQSGQCECGLYVRSRNALRQAQGGVSLPNPGN